MQTDLITEFQPGSDTRALRDALGRFATGVTVVTCATSAGPVGITANRFATFSAAQAFAIHVLSEEERDLAARFTRGGAGFDGLDWTPGPDGAPVISGTLARFDCRLHAAHDGGDHVILVGQVARASLRDGTPLLFSQGQFGRFAR
jgi:flavin reductase (DIM6/NTAB) family NADH-FMN oxidoreductase RutF